MLQNRQWGVLKTILIVEPRELYTTWCRVINGESKITRTQGCDVVLWVKPLLALLTSAARVLVPASDQLPVNVHGRQWMRAQKQVGAPGFSLFLLWMFGLFEGVNQ